MSICSNPRALITSEKCVHIVYLVWPIVTKSKVFIAVISYLKILNLIDDMEKKTIRDNKRLFIFLYVINNTQVFDCQNEVSFICCQLISID